MSVKLVIEGNPDIEQNLYYLQDRRQYVGNDILFWAEGGGYTTDVSKAEVMTEEDAFKRNKSRETDIPCPKDYIDAHIRPMVDMQNVNVKEVLEQRGLKLAEPYKPPRQLLKCHGCGQIKSERQYYAICENCGTSNLP